MTLFNLKGKGKKDKIGLEDKKLFSAIKGKILYYGNLKTNVCGMLNIRLDVILLNL